MLKIFEKLFKTKNDPEVSKETLEQPVTPENEIIGEDQEIAVVIGVALSVYSKDIHDYEMMILTIQKAIRPYSPWSSKIYGLRQYPRR